MAKSPATEAEELVAAMRRQTLDFMNLRRQFGTAATQRSSSEAYWREAQSLALELLGLASAFEERVSAELNHLTRTGNS